MNKYEVAVIFNPNLDEDALRAEFDKVQEYITRFEGETEKVDNWGKRKLAYEIKKVTEGFYYFITFNAPAAAPMELERRLRIRENIIRYLIIRKDA